LSKAGEAWLHGLWRLRLGARNSQRSIPETSPFSSARSTVGISVYVRKCHCNMCRQALRGFIRRSEVLFYALSFALACCGRSCGNASCRAYQYVGVECNLHVSVTVLKLQLQSLDCQLDQACIQFVDKRLANLSQLCKIALPGQPGIILGFSLT